MTKTHSLFIFVAAVLLFCLAAVDVLCGLGQAAVLKQPDSLLQLNEQWALSGRGVLFLKALMELAVSALLLAGKSPGMKLTWLAWLTTNLLVLRIGWLAYGGANYGDCAGNLIAWFTVSPRLLALWSWLVLVVMLAGSYGLLVWGWMQRRKPSSSVVVGVEKPV